MSHASNLDNEQLLTLTRGLVTTDCTHNYSRKNFCEKDHWFKIHSEFYKKSHQKYVDKQFKDKQLASVTSRVTSLFPSLTYMFDFKKLSHFDYFKY